MIASVCTIVLQSVLFKLPSFGNSLRGGGLRVCLTRRLVLLCFHLILGLCAAVRRHWYNAMMYLVAALVAAEVASTADLTDRNRHKILVDASNKLEKAVSISSDYCSAPSAATDRLHGAQMSAFFAPLRAY